MGRKSSALPPILPADQLTSHLRDRGRTLRLIADSSKSGNQPLPCRFAPTIGSLKKEYGGRLLSQPIYQQLQYSPKPASLQAFYKRKDVQPS